MAYNNPAQPENRPPNPKPPKGNSQFQQHEMAYNPRIKANWAKGVGWKTEDHPALRGVGSARVA